MRDTDLAWLAGLWEGEGSISMFSHTEKNGFTKLCPVCSIVNTDLHLINKVRELLEELGCKFRLVEFKPGKKDLGKRVQYRMTSNNMDYIRRFLTAVCPYLVGVKRAKAEILLSYVTQRLGKMEKSSGKGRTPYDKADWSHYAAIRSSTTTREDATA